MGPPATVLELGSFLHATEGEMVCESTNTKIPYFNAPIYLENKVKSDTDFRQRSKSALLT